jgi:hypothetical protein
MEAASLNGRGFFVTASPSTVTATLTNATGRFNWCAYGSDYPPNAVESGGVYTLRGTPPFVLTTASGTAEVNTKTYSGAAITALTDATGYPGVFCGKDGEAPGVLNCCVTGTIDCNGTCKTTGTYTQNDGACAGQCNLAYVRQFNQCGELLSATYSTYTNTGCTTPNYPTNDGECTGSCARAYVQLRDACGNVVDPKYSVWGNWDCELGCSPPYDPTCSAGTVNIELTTTNCELTCRVRCRSAAQDDATSYNYTVVATGTDTCDCYCAGCK